MIIFRYLSRQVLLSALAVSAVLTVIIVSGRLIKFLTYAAAGELSPEFVVQLVAYRVPGMLVLILPLGLFLGILLAFGRMYLDSEMVVLKAGGVSTRRLAAFALGPAVLVAMLVALLSFWLAPAGRAQVEQIYVNQSQVSELDNLMPGRFQSLNANRTVYTGEVKENSSDSLGLVFLSQRDNKTGALQVVVAESGDQVVTNSTTGERFVVLKQGVRYEGVPGQADYREVLFAEYGFLLPPQHAIVRPPRSEAMSMMALWDYQSPELQAELHWRLSMPLLALIVALLAVPLSKTNPRQGRYAMLIPSILLYLFYLTLLTSTRSAIEEEKASIWLLWAIHGAFFLLALSMVVAEKFWERVMSSLPSLPTWRRKTP